MKCTLHVKHEFELFFLKINVLYVFLSADFDTTFDF